MLATRFLVCLGILAFAGCGWPSARAPVPVEPLDRSVAANITVFSDGFHSGLILASKDMPFDVSVPQEVISQASPEFAKHLVISPEQSRFVELGFSEEAWGTGADRSNLHAARLFFWPGEGCLFVQYLVRSERAPDEIPSKIRIDLAVNRQALEILQSDLVAWIDPDRQCWRAMHLDNCYIVPTRYGYTLEWNCHDWTARTLRRMGLPMGESAIRTPGMFEAQLRRMADHLRATGTTVVGPGLVPPEPEVDVPQFGG